MDMRRDFLYCIFANREKKNHNLVDMYSVLYHCVPEWVSERVENRKKMFLMTWIILLIPTNSIAMTRFTLHIICHPDFVEIDNLSNYELWWKKNSLKYDKHQQRRHVKSTARSNDYFLHFSSVCRGDSQTINTNFVLFIMQIVVLIMMIFIFSVAFLLLSCFAVCQLCGCWIHKTITTNAFSAEHTVNESVAAHTSEKSY